VMRKSLQYTRRSKSGLRGTVVLAFHDLENRFDFVGQRLLPKPSDFQPEPIDDTTMMPALLAANRSEIAPSVEPKQGYFFLERVNNPVLLHTSRFILISFCHIVPLDTVRGDDFESGIRRSEYVRSLNV